MKTFSIIAAGVLLAMTVSGWANFGTVKDCGPSLQIQDAHLRATFAALDRQRSTEDKAICTLYREAVLQPAR